MYYIFYRKIVPNQVWETSWQVNDLKKMYDAPVNTRVVCKSVGQNSHVNAAADCIQEVQD